jgi:hypothetical protein
MMNKQFSKPEPTKDKKKTGKQRPNMMSNQGPGEDASTGVFAGGGMGIRTRKRTAKPTNTAMGGLVRFGKQ